jgi:hypothetical protein
VVDRLGGLEDELLRQGQLVGAVPPSPMMIRRGGPRLEGVCDLPAGVFDPLAAHTFAQGDRSTHFAVLPARLGYVWNTTYPSGIDDGLLWAGRGLSQILSAGFWFRSGMLSVTFAPEVSWSQNRPFLTVPTGGAGPLQYANPYYPGQIDLPQRFGAGPFTSWSLGQSSIRLERWGVAAGLSTENLWLGPGIRDAILLTDTGPGFPHLYVGTARPTDIWIGDVEGFLFWGRLERSPYAPVSGNRLIQGLALTYSPRWVPGLAVGLARMFVQPWDGLRFRDYFEVVQPFDKQSLQGWYGPSGDNPEDNQIASVYWRWVFPESAVEVYGEWAREDHEWNVWNFLREPDHSQAFLLGLNKAFHAGSGLLRTYVELAYLQEKRPLGNVRGVPVYYIHQNGLDLTNRGQLLGAWIGPGGDSQTLAIDWFHRGGRIGGYLERVRRNDGYYWAAVEPVKGAVHHDAEVLVGARQVLSVGPVEVSWDASAALRMNRDFIRDERNARLMLELRVPLDSVGRLAAPVP